MSTGQTIIVLRFHLLVLPHPIVTTLITPYMNLMHGIVLLCGQGLIVCPGLEGDHPCRQSRRPRTEVAATRWPLQCLSLPTRGNNLIATPGQCITTRMFAHLITTSYLLNLVSSISFSPAHDRFTDRRMRRSRERSLDRGPIRGAYSPSIPGPIPGGDRYRPEPAYIPRESFRPARVADCYRPKYDEDKGLRIRDRGSSTDRSRKNSVSGTAADRSPRSVSKWSSRGRSSSRSPSPLPPPSLRASSHLSVPHHEPGLKTLHDSRSGHSTAINDVKVEKKASELRDVATATAEKHDSRPPSRSSIASSRPSDRYPAPATPEPSAAVLAPTPRPPSVEPLPIIILDQHEEPLAFPSKRDHTTPAPLSPPLSPNRNAPAVVVVDAAELVVTIVEANDIDVASAPQHLITTEYSDVSRTGSIRSRSIAPMEVETTSQGSSSRHENLPSPVSPRISRLDFVEERQESDVVDAAQTLPATGLSEELLEQQETLTIDVHEPSPTPDLPERMPVIRAEVEHNSVTPHKGQDQEAEFTVQDIPSMVDAKSLQEALRIIVMTRILYDHQTLEDRVEPVLLSNAALIPRIEFPSITDANSWVAPESVCSVPWSVSPVRQALIDRSAAREAARVAKVRRLQEQYLAIHEQWSAQCALLDSMAKPAPAEEPPNPGRTTRRSAANLGDAVRSDLEMEQIIASLGNDELTDPNHLSVRNVADIPDMTSVICGDVDYFFDDTNHLVHDPATFYGPDTGIHDWTDDEKQVFLDKFAEYPKQFGFIAESLPNKTVSQCVDYYYMHKKSVIDFRKAVLQMAPNKRKRGARRGKQKGNGLLADIRQHDDEMHRDSGRPTISGPMTRRKRGTKVLLNNSFLSSLNLVTVQLEGTPTTTPTPEPETKQKRRRTNNTRANAPGEADEDPAVSFFLVRH